MAATNQIRSRSQNLSVSASGDEDSSLQPGLGNGYHVYFDGPRFVYIADIVDWYSRKMLSWSVLITMVFHFCLEVVENATERYGLPEITPPPRQFTSLAFAGLMQDHDVNFPVELTVEKKSSQRFLTNIQQTSDNWPRRFEIRHILFLVSEVPNSNLSRQLM